MILTGSRKVSNYTPLMYFCIKVLYNRNKTQLFGIFVLGM